MHDADRGRVVHYTTKFVGKIQPLPQPIDHYALEFGCSGTGPPCHRVDVERRRKDLSFETRGSGSRSEVGRELRMAPVQHPGNNDLFEISKNLVERFPLFWPSFRELLC